MPIVRFENVTKQFDEESYGVREINFSVEPGEFIFVTGPSGSGKTTLMRLLLKEYPFNSGEIFFHDTPISTVKNRNVHLHRRRIGVVFQDYKLIPEMNVWENIALPLWVTGKGSDEVERRVTDLLNLIKLPEKALHFPSQLSGGEAQRIGIARALAIGPEIVIADEPTGNLDPETALNVARLLKKINELGTTVIIATHDKNIISTYPDTRKIALEKGELIGDTHSTTGSKSTKKATSEAKKADLEDKEPGHTHTSSKHSKEQTIAEDTIPEAKTSSGQTTSDSNTALPWWKMIFGAKKDSATQDLAHVSENSSEDKDDTKAHSKSAKSAETTDDDFVTIKQETLDDNTNITSPDTDSTSKEKHTHKTQVPKKGS